MSGARVEVRSTMSWTADGPGSALLLVRVADGPVDALGTRPLRIHTDGGAVKVRYRAAIDLDGGAIAHLHRSPVRVDAQRARAQRVDRAVRHAHQQQRAAGTVRGPRHGRSNLHSGTRHLHLRASRVPPRSSVSNPTAEGGASGPPPFGVPLWPTP